MQELVDGSRDLSLAVGAIPFELVFGVPVLLLFNRGRVGADVLLLGCIDLGMGVLFALAFRATRGAAAAAGA